ncbi:hypothetical protein EFE40_07875 [Methanohalophilus halophilus]|uniref:UDP-glucose/GDP-mannose dehydrogenase C-terminal domain-containing protein n=1 Tax=Methanohalophilus halophilus TaxID=2177 RepID=A0A3M9L7K7_9EURY|nr:hypothetical protein EFE40_07875 [Methanohalophilus halophilus]
MWEMGQMSKVYDPYVEAIDTSKGTYYSEKCVEDALKEADATIFATDHEEFRSLDLAGFVGNLAVIDCKNIVKKCDDLVYLGIGEMANEYIPQTPLHPCTSGGRPQFLSNLQTAACKPMAKLSPTEGIPGDAVEEDSEFCVRKCTVLPQIVPGIRD